MTQVADLRWVLFDGLYYVGLVMGEDLVRQAGVTVPPGHKAIHFPDSSSVAMIPDPDIQPFALLLDEGDGQAPTLYRVDGDGDLDASTTTRDGDDGITAEAVRHRMENPVAEAGVAIARQMIEARMEAQQRRDTQGGDYLREFGVEESGEDEDAYNFDTDAAAAEQEEKRRRKEKKEKEKKEKKEKKKDKEKKKKERRHSDDDDEGENEEETSGRAAADRHRQSGDEADDINAELNRLQEEYALDDEFGDAATGADHSRNRFSSKHGGGGGGGSYSGSTSAVLSPFVLNHIHTMYERRKQEARELQCVVTVPESQVVVAVENAVRQKHSQIAMAEAFLQKLEGGAGGGEDYELPLDGFLATAPEETVRAEIDRLRAMIDDYHANYSSTLNSFVEDYISNEVSFVLVSAEAQNNGEGEAESRKKPSTRMPGTFIDMKLYHLTGNLCSSSARPARPREGGNEFLYLYKDQRTRRERIIADHNARRNEFNALLSLAVTGKGQTRGGGGSRGGGVSAARSVMQEYQKARRQISAGGGNSATSQPFSQGETQAVLPPGSISRMYSQSNVRRSKRLRDGNATMDSQLSGVSGMDHLHAGGGGGGGGGGAGSTGAAVMSRIMSIPAYYSFSDLSIGDGAGSGGGGVGVAGGSATTLSQLLSANALRGSDSLHDGGDGRGASLVAPLRVGFDTEKEFQLNKEETQVLERTKQQYESLLTNSTAPVGANPGEASSYYNSKSMAYSNNLPSADASMWYDNSEAVPEDPEGRMAGEKSVATSHATSARSSAAYSEGGTRRRHRGQERRRGGGSDLNSWRSAAKKCIMEQLSLYVFGKYGKPLVPQLKTKEAFKDVTVKLLDRILRAEGAQHNISVSINTAAVAKGQPKTSTLSAPGSGEGGAAMAENGTAATTDLFVFTKHTEAKVKKTVDSYVMKHLVGHANAGNKHTEEEEEEAGDYNTNNNNKADRSHVSEAEDAPVYDN